MWFGAGLLYVVGDVDEEGGVDVDVDEEAKRKKGGRDEREGLVGEVSLRIGANCGLSGVEDDDVEIGEFEAEVVGEGGRLVVRRQGGLLRRGE